MKDFGSNEIFIENYERLKSSRKMGELYGCDKKTITNHAKKIGYDYSKHKIIKVADIPIEQIIEDYETLKSAKAVGEKYNCSSTIILNYLKQNNYQPTNNNHKLVNITPEDFINKYDELKTTKEMAKYYNCSTTAILNYAKKIGYKVVNFKLSDEDKQKIIEAYDTNLTSSDLAQQYNVSRGMITKLWHDNNCLGKSIENFKTTEIDLTGKQFGKWTVINKSGRRNSAGAIYWNCKCECGIEKEVLGTSLRQGLSLSCGAHNNISKGNEKIKQILLEAEIPFEIEKTFDGCKDRKLLPFDFFVNNQYLIEYDGQQHYDINSKFDYEYTHYHDEIKSQWCKNNHIPLIRIPYTHFNNLTLNDLLLEYSNFIQK